MKYSKNFPTRWGIVKGEKSGAISPLTASIGFAERSVKTTKQFPRSGNCCKGVLMIASAMISLLGIMDAWGSSGQFLYLGAEPTYSLTKFDWHNDDSSSDTSPAANGQDVINQTESDTQATVFIGYGLLLDKIFLGAEAGYQFGGRTATSTTQDYVTQAPLDNKITMNGIYLIDFRPGYVLGDKNTMIYGILGLNNAAFHAVQTNSNGEVVQDSEPTRTNGLRFGAGYNLGLGRYFMARIEYVYTDFSSIQFTDTYPDGSETHTWKLRFSSNEISLGLSFIFNL